MGMSDLQAMLSADPSNCRPTITTDDLYVHLCEVVLIVINLWVSHADINHSDEHTRNNFSTAWPMIEGLLTSLRNRFGEMSTTVVHATTARRLLREVQRLEGVGRRVCGHAAPPEMA